MQLKASYRKLSAPLRGLLRQMAICKLIIDDSVGICKGIFYEFTRWWNKVY